MPTMTALTYHLLALTRHNHDGSYATQAARKHILTMLGEQLVHDCHFRDLTTLQDLRGRHIHALLRLWRSQDLSDATIANRLAHLRWVCAKIGKQAIIHKSNAHYGLRPRPTTTLHSKAVQVPETLLAQVTDPYIRLSLTLQQAFGLRVSEALKIKPHQADHTDRLLLQGSWCKNGRARDIPFSLPQQRTALDAAKAFVRPGQSLIPPRTPYITQLHRYYAWAEKLHLSKLHGLRHLYAQERFATLAGFPAPAAGGPARTDLTTAQRLADAQARLRVSHELGHGRRMVTRLYLGG